MLLTLMSILIIVIGIILVMKTKSDNLCELGCCMSIFGALFLIVLIIVIIVTHSFTYSRVLSAEKERKELLYKIENINTVFQEERENNINISTNKKIYKEYTRLHEKVSQWNLRYKKKKYYSKSLWINWFYNKKVIEAVKPVNYGNLEVHQLEKTLK